MTNFTRAIVRPPARNFSEGLTRVDLGKPDFSSALKQHEDYCQALRECGLEVVTLLPNEQYPDSTFVEDTAVLTKKGAILTNPGAESRIGEVELIKDEVSSSFGEVRAIESPGTLDGGDICEAGDHFFIGVSGRTNEEGAQQLAEILSEFGFTSGFVDIRKIQSILHLKSGLSYIGDNRLVVTKELAGESVFSNYELIEVSSEESYVANCVRVNEVVLIASGFPKFEEQLATRNIKTVSLDMSEYQKMDGGLSCLSLRF